MKIILQSSIIILFTLFTIKLQAQSCFNVSAGNDTTISCLQACLNLKARIPDVRTTDDYQVVSIPYQPFPFTNPGGILVDPSYQDDQFSPAIILPFTFCFYGQNFTSCTVGTNGIVTFDITNAGGFNDWNIPAGDLIPSVTYPRATIMGPLHDIDPSASTPQQPDKKMEYIIVGTAPCRKFILNFYKIPYYACGSAIVTQQIVLYEGTGIIDIFLKDKPFACGASSNNGRAILGIQNWDQNQATAVPGRNNSNWSATDEGWRFVPSGVTSLLNRVELYKNGTLVSNGTTTPLGNGELEALFPNICQTEDSMSYVVRAFYQQCDDPAIETEGSDTIIVYKTLSPVSATVTNVLCNGDNGNFIINSPVAANIEYSINGGATWQTSTLFNVPAGTYIVLARLIGSLCGSSATVIVTQPLPFTALIFSSNSNCAANTGSITITAAGGVAPYLYSIDNGVIYQASNQFLNLAPGNYNNIKVKDANGCLNDQSAILLLIDTMYLSLGPDVIICVGSSLTLTPQTNALTDWFKWTPAAGLNYDSIKNPIASPTDTMQYIVTAKWGVCQRKDTITIHVLHKPVAYAGKDTAICYKTPALLNGSATNLSGTVNYSWIPSVNVLPPNAANAVARPDTTQLFTLIVTDNYGCNFSVSDSIWVTMQSPVKAFAGNDTNAILGRAHQVMGSGGSNYLWSPAGPLNNPFIQNPRATLYNDTYFSLLVTDSVGCTGTDAVFIKVYEGPNYYVPNIFSPNGDGLNDIFRPIPVGIKHTVYFRVFDRYGKLQFQTSEWLKGWDGTIKGKQATAGAYVWTLKGIDTNGKEVEMQGTVVLTR